MKRKVMSMAMAAAMITVCLTGCGEKKTGNIEDALNSMSDEQLESAALAGASKTDTASNKADKVVFEPTEEILNADLNSGLIQINNDVFRQGGYQTVEEFVKQYSDKYDFTYCYTNNGMDEQKQYEECKDYLVRYCGLEGANNYLLLTPNNNSETKIMAYVANMTNKDEKITLEKAQLVYFYPDEKEGREEYVFCPMGFAVKSGKRAYWSIPKDIKSSNGQYTVKSLIELLKTNGYQDDSGSITWHNYNSYNVKDSDSCIYVSTLGEPNLAGEIPIYKYIFYYDENTDKIEDVRIEVPVTKR